MHQQGKPSQSYSRLNGSDAGVERLPALLQGLVAPKHIRHAVVAVVSGDGSFRWVGAAGDAHPDGAPMRVDTPIFMASVTKLYIAGAILKQVERKLVDLNGRMSDYLPASLIAGLHRMRGSDATEQITIRHLLGHLTGLPDYFDGRFRGEKSLMESLVDQDTPYTIEDVVQIVRERLVPLFPPQPLEAKRPRVYYSDTNYQLLIAIIEAVAGKPLHVVFEEMFFRPLKLEQTFRPGTLEGREPRPATIWFGDQPLEIPQVMHCCGDLVATVADMVAFMRALVRGEVFEDPSTLDLMMGQWNSFGFHLDPRRYGWPIEYGLGMMRLRMPRIFTPFRALPAIVGHTGFCGSWLFYCPDLDVLLAGTVDQGTAGAVPFRFLPRVLGALA